MSRPILLKVFDGCSRDDGEAIEYLQQQREVAGAFRGEGERRYKVRVEKTGRNPRNRLGYISRGGKEMEVFPWGFHGKNERRLG